MSETPSYRITKYEYEEEIRKKVSIYIGNYIFSIHCDSGFNTIYDDYIQDSSLNKIDGDYVDNHNLMIYTALRNESVTYNTVKNKSDYLYNYKRSLMKDQYNVRFRFYEKGNLRIIISNINTELYVLYISADDSVVTKSNINNMTKGYCVEVPNIDYNYPPNSKSARKTYN